MPIRNSRHRGAAMETLADIALAFDRTLPDPPTSAPSGNPSDPGRPSAVPVQMAGLPTKALKKGLDWLLGGAAYDAVKEAWEHRSDLADVLASEPFGQYLGGMGQALAEDPGWAAR